MFLVDLTPLYPTGIKQPTFIAALRAFYIDAYQDRFFTDPPVWFVAYIWLEALYHVPLSIWAVGALVKGEMLQVS
ncbi:MAG: hypothetical protein M1837_000282 [Sclerophora amabilis]|nr:MAG: hypothetical protein M1837_000282 [Sclerophora amabilis]